MSLIKILLILKVICIHHSKPPILNYVYLGRFIYFIYRFLKIYLFVKEESVCVGESRGQKEGETERERERRGLPAEQGY